MALYSWKSAGWALSARISQVMFSGCALILAFILIYTYVESAWAACH